jgi:hypothetical protein
MHKLKGNNNEKVSTNHRRARGGKHRIGADARYCYPGYWVSAASDGFSEGGHPHMTRGDPKIKLELSVSEAVALYYAAGSLRDDIICAWGETTRQPPVSGSHKTDRLILKSLELLADAIRKGTSE